MSRQQQTYQIREEKMMRHPTRPTSPNICHRYKPWVVEVEPPLQCQNIKQMYLAPIRQAPPGTARTALQENRESGQGKVLDCAWT